MKKIILSLALVLTLVLALGTVSAFAAKVVVSPQKLIVNGEYVSCEVYNIDGNNYFKLRDIAELINDTPGQFSVDWDANAQTISVVTGNKYTSVGGELVTGTDKSKSAVKSSQKLMINGKIVDTLSAYNIGGNNFFKLRDLGAALGFVVAYDKESNSMIIDSYSQREPADFSMVTVKADEELVYSNLIFTGDVTVMGTEGSVSFVNCEFKGDVINKGTGFVMVYIDSNCVAATNTKFIISNTRKEANPLTDDFPIYFVENDNYNVVCKDCFGAVLTTGSKIQFNGKVYSSKDITLYFDETNNKLVPFKNQEFTYMLIPQYWEKGVKKTPVICE